VADADPVRNTEREQVKAQPVTRHQGTITLVDSDPSWPLLFEHEAARVREVLGDQVLRLEHVGSTAVPGLAAKPVIDIVLVVDDSADESCYVPALTAAGYRVVVREPGWFEHRVLKGPETDINLHVFTTGAVEIDRMLRFRDRLRADAGDRALYARTKRALAGRQWRHVRDYAEAKSDVVREILGRAGD
jgi:GrpB-like predicted nucleotidyltransferase (UPF0157 family)